MKLPQRDNVIDVQVCVKANEVLLVLSGTGPIADICISGTNESEYNVIIAIQGNIIHILASLQVVTAVARGG